MGEASIEEELWNIFTFYTLHGNPLDPEHIRASQFVKLARDCQIVGTTLSEAEVPLTEADVNVAYTAEVTRREAVVGGAAGATKPGDRKMNYNDFLTVLMKLAVKVYPRSKRVDDAFQRLLMDNILPLASRRRPDAVDMFLENEDVNRLLDYYRDALEQIFAFYATSDKRTHAAMAAYAGTRGGSSLGYSGKSPMRATKAVNTMKGALGYGEFLKFASDFDLANSVILSTIELGDIYLSSIKAVEPDSTIRKLTFVEFWEALVRCSLVAYSKISDTSVLDKVRGLLLYMWRSINKNVPKAFTDRRNVSTYAGDLLSGAMLFNKRFTAAWAQDGYRDYLSPDPRVVESGKTVLSRIRGNLGGGSQGAGYASTLGAGGAAQAAAADAYYGAGSSASASDGSYGYGGGAAPAEGAGYGAGGYGGGNGEGGGNGGAGSGGVFYGYGGAAGNGGGPGGAGSYGY